MDLDDLNICMRTYFVNVHMFGEFGASRSIRLIPVHFVTDEHMSIHTAIQNNIVLLHLERCSMRVKIVDDTPFQRPICIQQKQIQKFLTQKRTSSTIVILLEFCCTASLFKVNKYAKMFGVNLTILNSELCTTFTSPIKRTKGKNGRRSICKFKRIHYFLFEDHIIMIA